MKEHKEYNEYGDKLVSLDVAKKALMAGFKGQSPECYAILHTLGKKPIISDEWSGLIPDDMEYLCDRPTQSTLQKWIREKHKIQIFIKLYEETKDYIVEVAKFSENKGFIVGNDYEKALEDGLHIALSQIIS